jgi:hypothetical protein
VGLKRDPLNLVSTIEELLGRTSSGFGLENLDYGRRDTPRLPRDTPLSAEVGINFTDKRRSLGRCSSLADSCHGVQSFLILLCWKLQYDQKEIMRNKEEESPGPNEERFSADERVQKNAYTFSEGVT